MGGTFSVKVVTPKDELETPGLHDVDRVLRSTLDRIEGLMSTWDRDSELSRFNRSTSLEPFAASPETFDVFKWSIDVGILTGGALDVTIGPLVDAWGFGPSGPRKTVPPNEEIARLREATGAGRLELNPKTLTVRKTRPEVQCDLSSVVPGYAADRLSVELEKRGFTDFLVDVGGEVLTRGRNETGAPWQIAIERPELRGDARSENPSSVRSMNRTARFSFLASAIPSSMPSTISAVSNASARTASASMTVTDASRCVRGRPVRGSRMCATRRPSTSRYLR